MCADPEPNEVVALFYREGAIMNAYSGRPETTDFLEMHGGMLRILPCPHESCAGQLLNVGR